jgi:hypothetical protein
MTNEQLSVKVHKALDLLKETKVGYPGPGKGTFWAPAMKALREVEAELRDPPRPKLVFPIAADPSIDVLVGLPHETAGINGNWARDFICHAGLGIVAVEAGVITRFSGRDPSDDQADRDGVYGWSTYYRTAAGYTWYATHQGRRYPTLRVGMHVQAGDLIGFVGDQRFRSDHLHQGCTSPKSEADARARIDAVARAPRVS